MRTWTIAELQRCGPAYEPEPGALVDPANRIGLTRLPCRSTTRASWERKLEAAFPGVPVARLEPALDIFADLFVPRFTDASVFRWSTGEWKALPIVTAEQLVTHLSAKPSHPVWLASRAWKTTKRIVLDLDNHDGSHTRFERTRRQVDSLLLGLGIDPADPRQVLVSTTPRGVHYNLFLAEAFFTVELPRQLSERGFPLRTGRLEVFPSTSHTVRVPFGFYIDRPHDALAWLRFIEAYQSGHIVRHDWCRILNTHLSPGRSVQVGRIRKSKRISEKTARPPVPDDALADRSQLNIPPGYDAIIARGFRSVDDFDLLWRAGIRRPNTRHAILSQLVQHLVWRKGLPPDQVTETVTAWALAPTHRSDTIRHDLADGGNRTRSDIESLVSWYVTHYEAPTCELPSPRRALLSEVPRFTSNELCSLWPFVQAVPPEDRKRFANFLVSFLDAARNAGEVTYHGGKLGYQVAVAAMVMRRWPEQCHMNYKASLDQAKALGLVVQVKEKWQNRHGAGRARTYHIAVPYDRAEPTIRQAEALAMLLTPDGHDDHDGRVAPEALVTSLLGEQVGSDSRVTAAPDDGGIPCGPPLERPREHLVEGPREGPEIAAPDQPLPNPVDGTIGPFPTGPSATAATSASHLWRDAFGDYDRIVRLNQALTDVLLEEPEVNRSAYLRRILTTPGERLDRSEAVDRNRLLRDHRDRYPSAVIVARIQGCGFSPVIAAFPPQEHCSSRVSQEDQPRCQPPIGTATSATTVKESGVHLTQLVVIVRGIL
jgi:hypothetical protein